MFLASLMQRFSEIHRVSMLSTEGSRSKCNISEVDCHRTNCVSLRQFLQWRVLNKWDGGSMFGFSLESCLKDLGAWNLWSSCLSLGVQGFRALWSCARGVSLSLGGKEGGARIWSQAQRRCSQGALTAFVTESGSSADPLGLLLEKSSRHETGWFAYEGWPGGVSEMRCPGQWSSF